MKNREFFADFIRAFSTVFVILIHTTCNYCTDAFFSNNFITKNTSIILSIILGCAVPFFFMVSGCFLIKDNNDFNGKYVSRIIKKFFQLLFWSTAYLLFFKFYLKFDVHFTFSFIAQFFSSQVDHMWFMYTLLLLYILNPIISKIYYLFSKKQLNYLIAITFAIPLFIKTLVQFFDFISMPTYLLFISEIGYFILGKYLYDNYEVLVKKKLIYYCIPLLVISIAIAYGYTVLNLSFIGVADKPFLDYSRMPMAFYIILLYVLILLLKDKLEKIPILIRKLISNIGQNSGGIYYIHMFVLYMIGDLYIWSIGFTSNHGRFMYMIFGAMLYFAVSLIIVNILRKIPILKQLVS